ncbi:MAG: spore germination protein [Anaerovoracaceae bacterium]|nr:spore germination protein [Anaerovoracaceae bacterium]
MEKYDVLVKEIRDRVPVGESFDLLERRLNIGGRQATMFFADALTDAGMMQRVLFSLFSLKKQQMEGVDTAEVFIERNLAFLDTLVICDVDQAVKFLYSGLVPLMISGLDSVIIIDCRSYPSRGVEEPSKEKSLRGAKDGFVESMMTNIALIRRRIRDNNLIFKIYSVGDITKSDVSMAYMKTKADEDMVRKLDDILGSIKTKGLTVTEQTLVEEMTGKRMSRFNPFPKVRYTQRPDIIAAHLEEGKIAVIVDNSPTVILLPAGIFDFVQDVDDYYFTILTGNYFRLLRILNILIILFLTPVYLLFAEGDIPVHDAIRFFITEEEFAVSIFWQLILLEIAIDGLKLASLNTPESLGMSLSVIGALILGEFSVSSGWFVPQTILCMAVVALASFTQPSIELGYAIKFVRILMLIGAHFFGWPGVAAAFVLSVAVMAATKTIVGTSYLSPMVPWDGEKLKKLIFRTKN